MLGRSPALGKLYYVYSNLMELKLIIYPASLDLKHRVAKLSARGIQIFSLEGGNNGPQNTKDEFTCESGAWP